MGGSGKLAGTHPIGEDSIFYNAGFKSYNITRCKDKVGRWFEWMEHSRHQMKRVKISIKVLKWLVAELKPPKCREDIIITLESTFKGGWGNIAHKIAGFIYEPDKTQGIAVKDNKQLHRSYEEAFFRDRWVTEETERAEIQSTANRTKTRSKEIGPILLDPIAGEKARAQALQIPSEDIINIEISANQTKENKAQSQITSGNRDNGELEIVRHMVDMPGKNKEELGEKSTAIMVQPLAEENTNGGAEDGIPLGIQFPEEDNNTLSTSEWIQQNIIKLSSEFGVNLKGCEDRARELLMKIDSNKQESQGET
ncbi:hypothetical protein MTR67_024684 [Solanum verrucosum]|uniref:Uncharacterized protein n=1 Tax=Solanum verrucosum TaxID=315347 RepID=A0AAF0TT70_SOLVR|nr:hypothetical protein MTR67_024684 [Solanum verrucosum]